MQSRHFSSNVLKQRHLFLYAINCYNITSTSLFFLSREYNFLLHHHHPTMSFISKLIFGHCMYAVTQYNCVCAYATCIFISQPQTSSWHYTAVTELLSFRELAKVTNSRFNSFMGNNIVGNFVRSDQSPARGISQLPGPVSASPVCMVQTILLFKYKADCQITTPRHPAK